MARITINTTAEERSAVLSVLMNIGKQTIAMSAIAKKARMNPNRVRYIIADLEETGKIRKIPTKAFNKHYIRYRYEVV